jgi:hypothetical protein
MFPFGYGIPKKPVKVDEEPITLVNFTYCRLCGCHYMGGCNEHGEKEAEKPKCLEKK